MNPEALRIGRIPFLVCAPYFHASLDGVPGQPGVAFMDGSPRALNKLLAEGKIDGAPSSSFEYARNAGEYLLIPGLCTSGRGEVKSVLLFSRVPWEDLGGKVVRLSPDSDTSNALVRVLSRFRFGLEPVFQDRGAGEDEDEKGDGEPSAKIAIGDAALREAASGRWPHRYDLARIWQDWQGVPLPLGVWILRAEAARKHPEAVRAYARHLRESLASFFRDPSAGLDTWEKAYGLPVSRAAALDFYSTADYMLTADHERSLEIFFRLCQRAGLLEAAPPLRWFGGAA